jgi:predicted Zn-ribbon and HTH transcriptional regulator
MKKTAAKVDNVKCARCLWVWVPRKAEPIACPKCKSYAWREASMPVKDSLNI